MMLWWIGAGILYITALVAICVFLKGGSGPREKLEDHLNRIVPRSEGEKQILNVDFLFSPRQ